MAPLLRVVVRTNLIRQMLQLLSRWYDNGRAFHAAWKARAIPSASSDEEERIWGKEDCPTSCVGVNGERRLFLSWLVPVQLQLVTGQ